MQLGIGSYTFTWAVGVPGHPPRQPLSALDLLKQAERLSVGVVQVCDNLPLTRLSPAELDEFAAYARERSIKVELGTRGLDADHLLAYLDLALQFQTPFVRLVIDSKGDEPSAEEAVARLRPVVQRFAAAGVKIALENHDRFAARTFVCMVEQLGPEHVGICLDTVNSFGALEGPQVVVEALAPYVLNLHVKDFTIRRVPSQMGLIISGCAAGRGRLDVPWLLERLRQASRDVNAILELWTPLGDSLDATIACERAWTEESVRYLRQLIPS